MQFAPLSAVRHIRCLPLMLLLPQPLISIFATVDKALEGKGAAGPALTPAVRQALLPDAIEAVGWGLAIVSEALATGGDARAPMGPGGVHRSYLQAQVRVVREFDDHSSMVLIKF